jgi:hypothetical protein
MRRSADRRYDGLEFCKGQFQLLIVDRKFQMSNIEAEKDPALRVANVTGLRRLARRAG